MNASTVVQLLILLDQLAAKVVELIQSAKDINGNDEAELQKLVAEYRAKNEKAFADVQEALRKRAEG